MAVDSNSVANEAIQLIGDNQPPVTGVAPNFDNSPAGKALSYLYTPCVQAVARRFGWDFARHTVALSRTGNPAPYPWRYEYNYPPQGVEVWQLVPPAGDVPAQWDVNNPLPVNWVVANNVVHGAQARVIHANIADAQAVYNNAPNEATWDSLFRAAVVRLLASELAIALDGKPDTSQTMMEGAGAFETAGETRMG